MRMYVYILNFLTNITGIIFLSDRHNIPRMHIGYYKINLHLKINIKHTSIIIHYKR